MYPEDVDPESGCRLALPKRQELDADAQRVYDSLADPTHRVIDSKTVSFEIPQPPTAR